MGTTTVELRIINGEWIPCKQCKWFSTCVVPRPKHLRNVKKSSIRVVGKCEEYTF